MSRRNPIDEIEQLFDRMSSELAAVGDELEPPFRSQPNVDVATRDGEVVVVVDLPGFEPDEIEVSLLDGDLHVSADRDRSRFEESATLHRRERRHDTVERRIRLPEPVVDDETAAEYEHGVLTVTLPTPDDDAVTDTSIEVN
ncbi:MAG: molecular chaperone, small heat shock protein [halophilic archaeon J07HB67]|nr:MAG: molecular chaperone, small heat shock protein [halophilic archaeon J07HB67]